MIQIILISFIIVIGVLLFSKLKQNEIKPIKFSNLASFITHKYKNCNNNIETHQKQNKNSKNYNKKVNFAKKDKIKYKPLKISLLSKKEFFTNEQNLTYIERQNLKRTIIIKELAYKIDQKINNNFSKFRSIKNQCIIETVAKSYAHGVLLEDNFNMFSSFKTLCQTTKVYKKEAEILNILVCAKLIELYQKLQNDVNVIKKSIQKAKYIKILLKKPSNATIYGIYLLNKSSSKFIIKYNLDVQNATSQIISELDEICYKQKIIYNYIRLLTKAF